MIALPLRLFNLMMSAIFEVLLDAGFALTGFDTLSVANANESLWSKVIIACVDAVQRRS